MKAALLAALVTTAGCERRDHTTPVVYELPAGFEGWVVVELEVRSSPPLPVVGAERVIRIPASGYLATSSRAEAGILHQRYLAVDASGNRTPLVDASRDRGTGPDAATRRFASPVVCCWHAGVAGGASGTSRRFEGFHVGRGPAGEPPDWSVTAP